MLKDVSMDEINEKVKKLLKQNTISGHSKYLNKDFHFMKPSRGVYKSQYFWDTCFHVFMMCEAGMAKMAEGCMKSLFALQKKNGFVGHIIYWKQILPSRITDIFQNAPSLKFLFAPNMSRLIQPPLAAEATWRIYKKTKDKKFLKDFLPHLIRYYDWLWGKRKSPATGLLFTISYFESGMDWKPSYDPALGLASGKANWINFLKVVWIDLHNFLKDYNLFKIYKSKKFIINDAGFNTIASLNYKALSQICDEINHPAAERYSNNADQLRQAILNNLYDESEKAFFDLDEHTGKLLKVKTPTIFYPLLLDLPDIKAKDIIEKHYLNEEEFYTNYPVPSVSVNHASFNPEESTFIWRGPTWAVNNYFLYQVLKRHGYKKEAIHLKDQTGKLISKGGFREYYNPHTGEGYGAEDFTWSGLYICMT